MGGITYFTDIKEYVDNKIIYPFSSITKDFFLFTPEVRFVDEDLIRRLRSYGMESEKDYFAMNHLPAKAGDRRSNFYGNVAELKTDVDVVFLGYNSKVVVEENIRFPKGFSMKIGSNTNLHIGKNTVFSPNGFTLFNHTDLLIGEGCIIAGMEIFINEYSSVLMGNNCSFQTGRLRTGRNKRIEIGNDIMASWDVIFLPYAGHLMWDVETGKCINNTTGEQQISVVIEDHVWLGGECVLAENTRIGSGSIVAYRAFAKGIYPNNCVIGGLPGKVIKKDIAWTRANVSYDEHKDYSNIPEGWRQRTIL